MFRCLQAYVDYTRAASATIRRVPTKKKALGRGLQALAKDVQIPGIALSGYGQEEDLRHSKEAGFAVHLTKPASPARLTEAIASIEPAS